MPITQNVNFLGVKPGIAMGQETDSLQVPLLRADRGSGGRRASDNKTVLGADMDGYFHISLVTPDRMEKCYLQDGTSPTHAIVATCYAMDRVKR